MYAVLEVPEFALVAVRRLDAKARGPAILVESQGRQPRVLMADAQAQAAGIEPGMTAPRAQARCDGLEIFGASPAAEAQAATTLLHAAFELAPRVEQMSPGRFLIDLQGQRHAEVPSLAETLLRDLHQQALPARLGIASTPGLAGFAARSTEFYRIVGQSESEFLSRTSISAAAPSAQLAQILRHWGLKTLGEFSRLSRNALAQRFGPEAMALWDACHGRDARPLDVIELPPLYEESMELDYAIETLEPLLFILRRFLDSLCLRLERRHCAATHIHLLLRLDDRSEYQFDCKLPEPTQRPDILFRTLQGHLDQVSTEAPVVALQLKLDPERVQVRQRGLFDTTIKDPVRFADTLDRLSGIVGAENVGTPRPEDSHAPDALRMERLPQSISPPEATPEHLRAHGLPLRRLRPPLPINVKWREGRPMRVVAGPELSGAVLASAGPYRSSGNWWESAVKWDREEWDVELPHGLLLRLLKTNGQCYIEGRYE